MKTFLLKLVSLFLFWEMKAISCEKLPRNWTSRTTLCTTPFTEQRKLALTRLDWGVGGPGAHLSKKTSTLVSSLRNRCLTSPQLAASLNSTHKTPVSTSTEKRRLWDADLLGRGPLSSVCSFAHINILFLLASLRYGFFFATLPWRPARILELSLHSNLKK